MIDLAENAGAEFSLNKKIWDVTLSDATLHIGETERGAWEDKSTIWYLVLMALFKNSPPHATTKYVQLFTRILNIGYKELNIPANPNGTHKLDKKFISYLATRRIYVNCIT
jgi:kynurenine 3-monooxygenase